MAKQKTTQSRAAAAWEPPVKDPIAEAKEITWEAALLAELLTVVDFSSGECDHENASRALRIFGKMLSNRISDANDVLSRFAETGGAP